MATTSGCDVCKKSSLSLLLLRPSPISKNPFLLAPGSQSVAAEPSSVTGLLPSRLPTEARFGLRLLRAGYVHVFIPNPPPRMTHWRVYRVTEQADLVPQEHALFSQPGQNVACERVGHIATGMKVLNIPQADKISEIWIAYSANLWNETLRKKNAGDAKVMQQVSLRASGPNTFPPTPQKLKAQVLECALTSYVIDSSTEQDFAFNSIAKSVDQLAAGLAVAAAKHPKTAGKELAVVLRDPVGIAAELNSLRVRRNEPIKREFNKPEIVHPINSSNVVLGIKKSQIDTAEAASFEEVTPLTTLRAFNSRTWPEGTTYRVLSTTEANQLLTEPGFFLAPHIRKAILDKEKMIWLFYPDHAGRARDWTERKAAKSWAKFSKYVDEEGRSSWVKNFNNRMKLEHYDPLRKMEEDWFSAAEDAQTLSYFARHFDPDSQVSASKPAVDSVVYAHESHLIHMPAPMTAGPVTDRYIAMLDRAITEPDAVILRKTIGNKNNLIQDAHIQLTGDPGDAGMRDKTFDMLKGYSELTRSGPAMQSHGWIGHALALYSIGQISALTGAAMSMAATHPPTAKVLNKLQTLMKFQKLLEVAVEGALKGEAPKLPVLLKLQVSADEALAVMAARPGQNVGITKTRIERHRTAGAMVTLTLLTDTDAIKAAAGDVSAMTTSPASGKVKMGDGPTTAATTAAAGKAPVLSKEAFLNLYQRQATMASKASNLIRNALPAMSSTVTGANVLELSRSLDGRLALASMVIQAIGMWNGMEAIRKADSDSARLDATYGLLDSVVGFSGGALQMLGAYGQIQLTRRVGSQAAEGAINRSMGLGAMRFLGGVTGVAGGFINMVASYKKSSDQKEAGNSTASDWYFLSAAASLGTIFSSGVISFGYVASSLSARGVGGAVVRTVAVRLGANAVLATVGGVALTASGVGLVLLGASVAFQVGAILLTPDQLQTWLARSYFGQDGGIIFPGKRDDMFPKGDWPVEKKSLEEVIEKSKEDLAKQN
ncbi:MAG: T6SS effector BTH_I2691 family protein [Duganella sp.]